MRSQSKISSLVKMNSYIVLLVPLLICSEIKCESDKIVGGDLISISDAPYQAALLYSGSFICGASIISTKYLLSAAHCVQEYKNKLSVRVGSNYAYKDGEVFQVEKATSYPFFNTVTLNNDFAILKLVGEIKLQKGVKEIIALPENNQKIENNINVYVTGYGMTKMNGKADNKLRGVLVPIVPQNICRNSYPIMITNNMVCAGFKEGGKDSCSNFLGGPMVDREKNLLVGVVSFGQGCALPKYYGVYAKVSSVRQWIKSQTKI
ncbi:unnamed protein product [Chironomus riparius]|uniref:trypsin n=1 Tax=Chironomus riparius TaxID=315576 RepID=A0A9N9RKX2_9DIPT|nr:unnamed protein product [Chironomus riparius]